MYKLLTIVGARPQFIKAAAVSHAITNDFSQYLQEDILHTGQHYDDALSTRFFDELQIPAPRYNLGVGSGRHGEQTARMLMHIEQVLCEHNYDAVLVYSDTNSTLAGTLAASKMNIPLFHVEAGLRSFNRAMPEEVNRIVADHLSALLFAPTLTAMGNLQREGFGAGQALFTGDVMYDNVLHFAPHAAANPIYSADLPDGDFALATIHRDFNTDSPERLATLLDALNHLPIPVLLPLHPRTRKALTTLPNSYQTLPNVHYAAPMGYLQTLAALQRTRLVLTDSGGLQKEAFFMQRPQVVLREETEWQEIVDAGAACLVVESVQQIVAAAGRMMDVEVRRPTQFGDGNAARKVAESICQRLG